MPTAWSFVRFASVIQYCAAMFWLVPIPAVEKLSLPGFARISAISAAAVRCGESPLTKQMYGLSSISDSIVNSSHLYGTFESSAGTIACVAMRATSNVYPSAGAVRTAIAPITPEAPTRFSATIGWLLRYFGANCATLRPERSESPPAANGITKVIGLDGYPCACAAPHAASSASAANNGLIVPLPVFLTDGKA